MLSLIGKMLSYHHQYNTASRYLSNTQILILDILHDHITFSIHPDIVVQI